jgi:class 3 adenylate cyclase/tetratricopeptide (TPR) repeat protein
MEHAADAGEILVSPTTAAQLPARRLGAEKDGGRLLRWRVAPDCEPAPILARAVPPEWVERAIPVALRRQLSSGVLDSEHRVATIGFLRYRGLDQVIATEGPEGAAARLDGLVRIVQEAVDEEGVTFLATDIDEDGGKIIVAGGVPVGLDDDEGRVLRAAHAILGHELPLPVSVGINRGHVFAGEIGTEYRRTYTVMGDTVNLAARLMAAAPAGSAYVTATALERSRTIFDAHPLPPFQVKGKAEPVHAYELGEVRGRRTDELSRSRFTGRGSESAQLLDALDRAADGKGGAVLLEGERGLGKSRLLEELGRERPSVTTVTVQGEPYGTAGAYLAVRPTLADWLRLDLAHDPDPAAAISRGVEARAPDRAELAPLLGPVLGVAMPDTPATASIAPEFRVERLALLVEDVLRTAPDGGRDQPLLLVIEDAHWLDPASSALLERIAQRAADHPWLVVASRRPDEGTYGAGEVLQLRPLSDDEARALVDDLTDGAPLRPGEVEAIVERAGGSPLFLEEIVHVARDLGVEGLPESLDGLAAAEIDALPPLTRRVLRIAAVLGRAFDRDVLVRMLEDDEVSLDDATLQELSRYLVPDGPDGFQFRHALQCEAAYEGLSFGRRRELHLRAADALHWHPSAGRQPRADLLSLHCIRAHDWDRAWTYTVLAAHEAEAASAPREAAIHYGRAVEAARRLPAVDPPALSAVWEGLGNANDVLGALPEADAAYRRATSLVPEEDVVRRARLGDKRVVVVGEHQQRHAAAVRIARQARRLLDASADGGAAEVRAQLLAHEAAIRYHQGKFRESIELCTAAMAEVRPGEEPVALATALSVSDAARYSLGLGGDPELTERALAIYVRHGVLLGVAVTLTNLGTLAYFDGGWDTAADYYQQAIDASERAGDAVAAAIGAANLAELRLNQGRDEEAGELLRPAQRTLVAMDAPLLAAFAAMQMGRLEAMGGDRDAMREWMQRAVDANDDIGASEEATIARIAFADAEIALGQVETAEALLDATRERGTLEPGSPTQAAFDRVEAAIKVARGDRAAARELAERAAGLARESGAYYDLVGALELLHELTDDPGTRMAIEAERERWTGALGMRTPVHRPK